MSSDRQLVTRRLVRPKIRESVAGDRTFQSGQSPYPIYKVIGLANIVFAKSVKKLFSHHFTKTPPSVGLYLKTLANFPNRTYGT